MNSGSDSDWDSMSEAPPIPANNSGLVNTKHPPPVVNNKQTVNKIKSQQHLTTDSTPTTQQSQAECRERTNIIAKQAALQHQLQKSKPNLENSFQVDQKPAPGHAGLTKKGPLNNKPNAPTAAKRGASSKDSGIDTGTVCSSNVTPATVRGNVTNNQHQIDTFDLKGDVLEVGFVNHGFDEDSEDSTNENDISNLKFKPYPEPDEKINLLQFEEIKTKYFQIEFENDGLLVDKAIPIIVSCCTKVSAEILGLFKIPLVLVFVLIGQILRVFTSSILRPFSDFIFKPLLVSLHNLILSPLFSLMFNISSMMAITISPCCAKSKYSPVWNYGEQRDQHMPV